MNFGTFPLLPLIKHLMYMEVMKKVSKEMWENQIFPWTNRESDLAKE